MPKPVSGQKQVWSQIPVHLSSFDYLPSFDLYFCLFDLFVSLFLKKNIYMEFIFPSIFPLPS